MNAAILIVAVLALVVSLGNLLTTMHYRRKFKAIEARRQSGVGVVHVFNQIEQGQDDSARDYIQDAIRNGSLDLDMRVNYGVTRRSAQ